MWWVKWPEWEWEGEWLGFHLLRGRPEMADRQEYIRNAVSFLADPKVSYFSISFSPDLFIPFSRHKLPLWHSVSSFSKQKVSPVLKLKKP